MKEAYLQTFKEAFWDFGVARCTEHDNCILIIKELDLVSRKVEIYHTSLLSDRRHLEKMLREMERKP